MSDMRVYETFYGIYTDNWTVNWGTFSNQHHLLVKEYISDGCNCTEHSSPTGGLYFIYPHHLAKTYFIEGVIEGQITIGCEGADAYVCAYKVTVGKMHENGTDTPLFSTQWVYLYYFLDWDSEYEVGEEIVFPFWIDAWSKAKVDEFERIYVKVEVSTSSDDGYDDCETTEYRDAVIWHSNDATWEDLKITIPFMGL
jgi:hypothetical protein